jgi:hypothetical protein
MAFEWLLLCLFSNSAKKKRKKSLVRGYRSLNSWIRQWQTVRFWKKIYSRMPVWLPTMPSNYTLTLTLTLKIVILLLFQTAHTGYFIQISNKNIRGQIKWRIEGKSANCTCRRNNLSAKWPDFFRPTTNMLNFEKKSAFQQMKVQKT